MKKTINKAQLLRLAEVHIKRFTSFLDGSGAPAHLVDRPASERYLSIWKSIHQKATEDRPDDLTDAEKTEIGDAVFDGGYDYILEDSLPN